MDWDKLRIFHAAAEAGSFTHAGEALNMSQSAVSRQVSALEQDLGVPLFHRHARGLILTEQGEELHRTAGDVLRKLESVRSRLTESAEKPTGTLRITTTVGFGSTWLTQRLHEFVDMFRTIRLRLILDDEETDLSMPGGRGGALRQPVNRTSSSAGFHRAHADHAAPAYLKRFGTPQTVADSTSTPRHLRAPVPAYRRTSTGWNGGPRARQPARAVLKINNIFAIKNAVRNGTGIAVMPNYMVEPDAGFVRLLPDEQVRASQRTSSIGRVEELRAGACFRDFLLQKAQNWSY